MSRKLPYDKESFTHWLETNYQIHSKGDKEWVCACPHCGKSKLYINIIDGFFICFVGCWKGHVLKLIWDKEKNKEAVDRVFQRKASTTTSLRDKLYSKEGKEERIVPSKLPEEFIPCWDGRRLSIPKYLARRLPEECVKKHSVGYALRGRYHNRAIFPMQTDKGVSFVARLMGSPEEFSYYSNKWKKVITPTKYLTQGGETLLYGLTWARPNKELYLVEGVFDSIQLTRLGVNNLATLGKEINKGQMKLLKHLSPAKVVIAYDEDALKGALKAAKEINYHLKAQVYISILDEGDPDELVREHGVDALPILKKKVYRLGDPILELKLRRKMSLNPTKWA